jgi:hypothetical protein
MIEAEGRRPEAEEREDQARRNGQIFRTRISVSSRAKASVTVLSASTLDTLSRASLSAWEAQSSASLTRAMMLAQVAAAS